MTDITKYESVIKLVLKSKIGPVKIKLNRSQKEDLVQDCYVALLENQDKLMGPDDEEQAEEICRSKVRSVLGALGGDGVLIKLVSADDPVVARHLEKVEKETGESTSESELYAAIESLNEEERTVIRVIFIDGLTQKKAAEKLGITLEAVRWRKKCGIMSLKKYFEV
jgi:RNA polymerase sigma factor (sigma-70 family)